MIHRSLNFKTFITPHVTYLFLVMAGAFLMQSCKKKIETTEKGVSVISLDSIQIDPFLKTYSELQEYEVKYDEIYAYYDYHYIWFHENGLMDYGNSLYQRVKDLEEDGIYADFPYQQDVDSIVALKIKNPEAHPEAELLMTGLYLFYLNNVYKGIDPQTSKNLGWLLPRKDIDDTLLLDAFIADEEKEEDSLMFRHYYTLKETLKKYRAIQELGGWSKIPIEDNFKGLKLNDTSMIIPQIRERLTYTEELSNNNKSNVYDKELLEGILKFQKKHGFNQDTLISKDHIMALNMPVEAYIKKLVVNMERCRWIPPGITNSDEFIFVNIPSYDLKYYRDGEIELESSVVVGKEMTKTVIFDGKMTYLAFSPYWNIPQSIIKNEIIPGMERDENYLRDRNMEWNDGQVRQLSGGNNSLGLVKFMFPNSNNIYLHDTPAKSLFKDEDRARSHGCIRVAKARELAISILQDDENWNEQKIDAAMHAGKETTYTLDREIPVYIGYFTAWVDTDGTVNFYKDVYKRDDRLADILLFRE